MTSQDLDAAERVQTLIALTEELTAIFEIENASLIARRPSEIAPLQADKARLAAAYAQSIRAIAADRSIVAGADGALMEKLKALTQSFETRASEQRALLEGARLAAEGVVRAVAAEADLGCPTSAAFRPRGDAPAAGAPAPLSINERA